MAHDIPALVPRRRNFNLRNDPSTGISTTSPAPATVAKKESKKSWLSRFLHSKASSASSSKHGGGRETIVQDSPLLQVSEAILERILFYALDLPQKISLNFPYSPLPEGCSLHLASTPPPPVFLSCKSLRQEAKIALFRYATFNITILSGSPTAHFWLRHNWAGDFEGPKRCVQTALERAKKVEIVLAAPTVNTQIDTSRGDLGSLVRKGAEKDEWDAVRKCLAICVAYLQGQKLGKAAVRDLSKQIEKQNKNESVVALGTGGSESRSDEARLTSLRVVISKRDQMAFVTNVVNEILDMIGEVKVDREVEVVVECLKEVEPKMIGIGRVTDSAEIALTKEWPYRARLVEHLRELGKPMVGQESRMMNNMNDYAGEDARGRGGWWFA